jgi:hypothetical protein
VKKALREKVITNESLSKSHLKSIIESLGGSSFGDKSLGYFLAERFSVWLKVFSFGLKSSFQVIG